MKYILSFLGIILFVGCGFKEIEQKPQSYRLKNITVLKPFEHSDSRILKIQKIEGDSSVMTRSILYEKEGALKPYKYSRWSEIPSTRLQQIIVEYLEDKKVFASTIPSLSFANSELLLESELQNFEQVFQNTSSTIFVKLRFRLVEKENAKVVASTSISSTVKVKDKSTNSVIIAFNEATHNVIKELASWIRGIL